MDTSQPYVQNQHSPSSPSPLTSPIFQIILFFPPRNRFRKFGSPFLKVWPQALSLCVYTLYWGKFETSLHGIHTHTRTPASLTFLSFQHTKLHRLFESSDPTRKHTSLAKQDTTCSTSFNTGYKHSSP